MGARPLGFSGAATLLFPKAFAGAEVKGAGVAEVKGAGAAACEHNDRLLVSSPTEQLQCPFMLTIRRLRLHFWAKLARPARSRFHLAPTN